MGVDDGPALEHEVAPLLQLLRRLSQNDESPVAAGLSEAAEGTRTLDLLHGKQTL
jgi:hypothetical protein